MNGSCASVIWISISTRAHQGLWSVVTYPANNIDTSPQGIPRLPATDMIGSKPTRRSVAEADIYAIEGAVEPSGSRRQQRPDIGMQPGQSHLRGRELNRSMKSRVHDLIRRRLLATHKLVMDLLGVRRKSGISSRSLPYEVKQQSVRSNRVCHNDMRVSSLALPTQKSTDRSPSLDEVIGPSDRSGPSWHHCVVGVAQSRSDWRRDTLNQFISHIRTHSD